MFFRRESPRNPTFDERMENVRKFGFTTTALSGGRGVRASRGRFAIDLNEDTGVVKALGRAGIIVDDEIGALIDGGYQKFFRTPAGKKLPALADDLKGLHDFEEDLREALGQESYYNESLGTVSTYYLYDRVKDRDHGVPKRAWEA
jgi:hypothetical protein